MNWEQIISLVVTFLTQLLDLLKSILGKLEANVAKE
jgi:hypothetical protein